MGKVYYNQADSRWARHPYPSSSYPNATIKSGGCGPTAGAMIVSSFKETILPSQMGDIFRQNGYRASSGTSGNVFPFVARKWGLTCNVKVRLDDAIACLRRGGMVVANVRGGSVFSTGGHYIVLAYMKDNNTIAVFDPYMYANKFNTASRRNKVSVSGNTVFISYSNMKNYGLYSNLYCFEAPVTQNKVPTQVSSASKYSTGTYQTTANVNVRTGAGTNYKAKTTKQLTANARAQNKKLGNGNYNGYLKGVVCTVTKVEGNWGYTASGWICLDYAKKQ